MDFSGSYLQMESEDKTGRFLSVSLAVHAGLFFLASLIALPLVENKMSEVIAFEIVNPTPKSLAVPAPAATVEKQIPQKVVQAQAVPKNAKPIIAKSIPASAQAPKVLPQQNPAVLPQQTPEALPQGIDDIVAPNLDEATAKIASTAVGSVDEKDFAKDLESIDIKNRQKLSTEQKQLAAEAQKLKSQSEKDLAALDAENQEQGLRLQQAAAALRARNQAQATQSIFAQQQAAKKLKQQGGSGTGVGTGTQMVGAPGVVRKLGDLKQMAGNPQPEFSPQERLLGHQGRARFLAYVSAEGKLSEFKLLESTGYRNLDSKTLVALKKWRFFPGQEGWVEIPTQWSLTGGAEEQPTLLRRSQN